MPCQSDRYIYLQIYMQPHYAVQNMGNRIHFDCYDFIVIYFYNVQIIVK